MITGFNTDIEYEGVTYHVQTEDKGPQNPILLSLVYIGGRILASKRTNYTKELSDGISQKELAEKLEKQHRLMLAVINRGRINELINLRERELSVENLNIEPSLDNNTIDSPLSTEAFILTEDTTEVSKILLPLLFTDTSDFENSTNQTSNLEKDSPEQQLKIEQNFQEKLFYEFDLDRIITEYLQAESKEEKPEIQLLGNTSFIAGETISLQIQITHRTSAIPIPEASVVIKILGTTFTPRVYYLTTKNNGIIATTLTLPDFTTGSAAIVIQTSSDVGEAEIKHLIRRR